MARPNRGWNDCSRCTPAADIDIRCGHDVLRSDSAQWPVFGVVSTPTALATAQPFLARQPQGVAFARWLDSQHQRELSRQLPDDIELVVGIGGGKALDASKFVALDRDLPLVLVPTILSTGAIIHSVVANWEGRKLIGDVADWPWVDCEYVLVDCDVALAAPAYLNTAGLGDILCGYACLAEWSWRADRGIGPAYDAGSAADFHAYQRELVDGFCSTLDGDQLTAASVRHIMKGLQERDDRHAVVRDGGESGDHPFWLALELINDKAWVHGELVALGAVMISWQAGFAPEELVARLRASQVRFSPQAMSLTREELRRGVDYVPLYMEERNINSILRSEPIVGSRFDEMWEFLHS